MYEVDWAALFSFSMSPIELIVRGSVMYVFLFLIFRFVLHRDVGAVGIADLLLLVIVADAAQNAMGNGYESIPDGIVLVSTIVGWNYLLDYLSFRFKTVRKFSEPAPLCMVQDGVKLRRNMRREYLSDSELDAMLRERGVESAAEVKSAYLEADGKLSVIRKNK
jgi:uncharacterized membrane protein YcaP (DUF421 family)